MGYFKLQAGCLTVLLYILWIYWKEMRSARLECSRYFDCILRVAPWAIFFDGATAWTVNHMDIVPAAVNLILHGLFFIFMDLMIIFSMLYMLNILIGIPENRYKRALLLSPSMLSLAGILLFLKELYYIHGSSTWYSMGVSVIICYASLVIHFGMIISLIVFKYRSIEKRKRTSLLVGMLFCLCTLIYQVLQPEALVSSIFPVMMVLGIYINFEDPSKKHLEHYNSEVVSDFAALVESRDDSTGNHIKRTRGYVSIILGEMKKTSAYQKYITRDYVSNVLNAAPMHDIGKIAIPDSILQKPGRLTEEEFSVMKTHAVKGGEIIMETFSSLNEPDYLKIAYETARHHHEKWNGKGYPDGLSGEDIPLHARIMAIADVFDAVSEKRCYRDAMPLEQCFEIIRSGSGSDFDPQLAGIFLSAEDRVREQFSLYRSGTDTEGISKS